MNLAFAADSRLTVEIARGTLLGRRAHFLHRPSLKLSTIQRASLYFVPSRPVSMPRRTRFDCRAGGSMDDQMAKLRFPLTVEHETLSMVGNPIQIASIFIDENDHLKVVDCGDVESEISWI